MKRKTRPVTDPVRDAAARSGSEYVRRRTVAPWQEEITFCTTGQFARLDKGYRRHCGPTAITNLILTLNNRYGYLNDPAPADVFSKVSSIGQKRGIYWNTDILHRFGGTYDIMTEWYIRASLHQFCIPCRWQPGFTAAFQAGDTIEKKNGSGKHAVSIRWHAFPTETQFIQNLDAGKLLFLQLHRHPCYGSHHLLCYGYTMVHGEDRKDREVYLLLADGWNRRPRYLRLKGRGICHFFAIGYRKERQSWNRRVV